MLQAHTLAAERNITFTVTNTHGIVTRVLELTDIQRLLTQPSRAPQLRADVLVEQASTQQRLYRCGR